MEKAFARIHTVDERGFCDYCREAEDVSDDLGVHCGKTDGVFICTRIEGHTGIHAACGCLDNKQHPMSFWKD